MSEADRITPEHLGRAAVVYIRQSTAMQVRQHLEGQRLQYSLVQRATVLGFREVKVIDEDLGRSGTGTDERPGFARLLAAVCDSTVGMVVAFEASRLARNNRDWYHLLDLCALTGTLVADAERVYDPRSPDDRLVLGLKGTMSEFEVSLLRQRAEAARRQMIRRGEVLTCVPVGYVRTEDHRIEMIPDLQVQEALRGVYRKFRELGSARQVVLYYRQERIPLPAVPVGGDGRAVVWQLPLYDRIIRLLKHPVYAGAFAFGRTRMKTEVREGRARKTRSGFLPMEDWQVLIRDHHPGYISWEDYLRNQEMLAENTRDRWPLIPGSGAAKAGPALLAGLLRCRRCGRKMHILYSGKRGVVGRYHCRGANVNHGGPPCLSFTRRNVDRVVSETVLRAIEPAGLEAALAAHERMIAEEDEKRKSVRLALEKARYEAERAKRQYDLVEPENRLVAGELERRWNEAIAEATGIQRRLEEIDAARRPVSEAERARLLELGADLERAWNHPAAPTSLKKRILRTVIEEILADAKEDPPVIELVIRWAGGVHSSLTVRKSRKGEHCFTTKQDVVELVRQLAEVCPDQHIARLLNRFGYRTGKGNTWTSARVRGLRNCRDIPVFDSTAVRAWVNLTQAANRLGVSDTVVKTLIRRGVLPARQVIPGAPWVISAAALESPAVKEAVEAVREDRRGPPADPAQIVIPFKPTT